MGNMIDLDITLVIQLVNTVITLVVLNFLLLKPIREQIRARRELTSSQTADIERFTQEAKNKISDYEHALTEARTEATHIREAMRAEAMRKEEELVTEAHRKSHDFLEDFRGRIAAEGEEAKRVLRLKVDDFANQAIDRILM